MNTISPPKNQPQADMRADWHPADIKAALEKRGWSLRRLSAHNGLAPTSLRKALSQSWPRAERIIADAIGVPPDQIWPSRYQDDRRSAPAASVTQKSTP